MILLSFSRGWVTGSHGNPVRLAETSRFVRHCNTVELERSDILCGPLPWLFLLSHPLCHCVRGVAQGQRTTFRDAALFPPQVRRETWPQKGNIHGCSSFWFRGHHGEASHGVSTAGMPDCRIQPASPEQLLTLVFANPMPQFTLPYRQADRASEPLGPSDSPRCGRCMLIRRHHYEDRMQPSSAWVLGRAFVWAWIGLHLPSIANFFSRTPYLSDAVEVQELDHGQTSDEQAACVRAGA
jgi:hypothetical protein